MRDLFVRFVFTLVFPASGQAVVTGVVPSPPRFLPIIFYRVQGSTIPLPVDFSSSVAFSRSRAFCKSICAQEKVPTNLTSVNTKGLEPTRLAYTRLEDNLIRHRGDRQLCNPPVRPFKPLPSLNSIISCIEDPPSLTPAAGLTPPPLPFSALIPSCLAFTALPLPSPSLQQPAYLPLLPPARAGTPPRSTTHPRRRQRQWWNHPPPARITA